MFISGILRDESRNLVPALASMGPLMFISGIATRTQEADAALLASMGPLMFISGIEGYRREGHELYRCFNGAADVHQRNLPVLRLSRLIFNASMGPLMFISGIR